MSKTLEMTEDDADALVDAIGDFKEKIKRNRHKTTVDIFAAGFYYGVAHARGESAGEPPAAPDEAPKVEED